jgi:hypothetical protein
MLFLCDFTSSLIFVKRLLHEIFALADGVLILVLCSGFHAAFDTLWEDASYKM